MAREKRKLHPEKSSRSMWPWVLVLLISGIGLGMLFSDRLKGGNGDGVGAIAENEKEGQKEDQKESGGGDSKDNVKKDEVNLSPLPRKEPKDRRNESKGSNPKPAKTENPKLNTDLFEFIKKNRVYLVPTEDSQAGFSENDPVLKDLHFGAFFKAIKVHYNANKIETKPAPFEAATWTEGPNPMGLKADTSVTYVSNGGTQARPVHYDLGHMTALASSLNPGKKPAGVYFNFPRRQWIHIQGKDIGPFYLVPLETGRYPALVTLKVTKGIVFDDKTMTAKVKPEISGAIKKLLKENNFSSTIMLRAGAPLAKWGLAHVNTTDTIDFKKVYLEPQITAANDEVMQRKHFVTWTDNAIRNLFPAAQNVRDARAQVEAAKKDPVVGAFARAELEMKRAYAIAHKVMITFRCYIYFGGKNLTQLNDTLMSRNPQFKAKFKTMMVIPGTNRKQSQFDYIRQHCENYFGAREKVNELWGEMAKKQQEFRRKQATFIKETAAFTKINALYSSNNTSDPELDVFKANLAKNAGLIMSGKTVLAAAKKTWEQRKKKMPGDSRSKAAEWNDKNHQKNEWEKFKKHQVFYLGGNIGIVNKAMVSLVQFNK